MSDIVVIDEIIIVGADSAGIISTIENHLKSLTGKTMDCRWAGKKIGTARNFRQEAKGIAATITILKEFKDDPKTLFTSESNEMYILVYKILKMASSEEIRQARAREEANE